MIKTPEKDFKDIVRNFANDERSLERERCAKMLENFIFDVATTTDRENIIIGALKGIVMSMRGE